VLLHIVKLFLSLWAVPPLPEPLNIELCCCGKVVFRWVQDFALEKRRIIICVATKLCRSACRVGSAIVSVSLLLSSNRLSVSEQVVVPVPSSLNIRSSPFQWGIKKGGISRRWSVPDQVLRWLESDWGRRTMKIRRNAQEGVGGKTAVLI
jgi:hypothetical protein